MIKVSIALCTYNGAKFLSEQLQSIANQTLLPDELIVGDDCSQDQTIDILQDFARKTSFPVEIHINEKNLKSTKNFEQTIARCTGDVIFLSDQDDVWLPQKLEKVTAQFIDSNVGFVFTNAELTDENLESLGINLWDISFTPEEQKKAWAGNWLEVLLRRNVVTGATMAFRTKFRDTFTPIPTHLPNIIHDAWIALIIAAQASVNFIDEPLIKYRQHNDQQLGIDWQSQAKQTKVFPNTATRYENYTRSIEFHRKEEERLSLMFDELKKHSVFNQHVSTTNQCLIENRDELRELIKHYESRRSLPANRLGRIKFILNEFATGRYHRFSKGLASAAKDFYEKW